MDKKTVELLSLFLKSLCYLIGINVNYICKLRSSMGYTKKYNLIQQYFYS